LAASVLLAAACGSSECAKSNCSALLASCPVTTSVAATRVTCTSHTRNRSPQAKPFACASHGCAIVCLSPSPTTLKQQASSRVTASLRLVLLTPKLHASCNKCAGTCRIGGKMRVQVHACAHASGGERVNKGCKGETRRRWNGKKKLEGAMRGEDSGAVELPGPVVLCRRS